ncbi:hypothetical protein RUM43_001497 [Polyplax serrata]|uniref:Uncharacterized protein n=1 Tax=Polyplax serrata TaxID=468196 RepID=A0AAN8XS86_POLSC
MDCIQLQLQPPQLRTQPFHYLINEQAKSLLALQELQNEVGALLEFRDLVMETFPNLRQKMSGSSSQTFSNTQNYCSNLPLPLSGSLNSRYWEPGIRVKRKIVNKSENDNSFVRVRAGSKIQSNQPKSSEAISGVQDSGFSTETNSSNKDHVSSTATSVPLPVQTDDPFLSRKEGGSHKESPRAEYDRSDEEFSEDGLVMKVNEAEEELWNLLDVIHTKGTKLQEEVETLQLRLMVEEIENHVNSKELELRKVRRKFHRRCRSLENVSEGTSSLDLYLANVEALQPSNFKFNELSFEEDVFRKKQMTRSIEMEDIDQIRQERNLLLDKLTEMESEKVASRKKTSELQHEISVLISTKEELQEQLFQAVKQKTELNSRINELHMKFVTGDKKWRVGTGSTTDRSTTKDLTDSESSSQTEKLSLIRSKSTDDTQKILNGDRCWVKRESLDFENVVNKLNLTKNLGTLDGILTNPMETRKCIKLTENSRKKVTAILKEKNYLELQRHLLVSIVQNQVRTHFIFLQLLGWLNSTIRTHIYTCKRNSSIFKTSSKLISLVTKRECKRLIRYKTELITKT